MKNITTLLFCFLLVCSVNAQTTVKGGIYTSTTWTVANSPYSITDTLVVFDGVALTIEPGVTVEFSTPNSWIDVRGTLIANGSLGDTISFYTPPTVTSNISPSIIYVQSNAQLQIGYCKFTNSTSSFINLPSSDSIISNCTFINSSSGNGALLGGLEIVNCTFINNRAAVVYAGRARNCTFTGNLQGAFDLYSLYNCTFTNNTYSTDGIADSIVGCTFKNNLFCIGDSVYFSTLPVVINNTFTNNHIAIQASITNSNVIQNNTIYNNEIGLNIDAYSATAPYIINNKICDNQINAKLLTTNNLSLPNNCWCSNDSTAIRATIEDGFKNVAYGLFNYEPILNCDSSTVTAVTSASSQTDFTVYPNPNQGTFTISVSAGNASAVVYNSLGVPVTTIASTGALYTVNLANSTPGIYMLVIDSGAGITAKKIVVE